MSRERRAKQRPDGLAVPAQADTLTSEGLVTTGLSGVQCSSMSRVATARPNCPESISSPSWIEALSPRDRPDDAGNSTRRVAQDAIGKRQRGGSLSLWATTRLTSPIWITGQQVL